MSTAQGLELMREERDLLELLCQIRLRQVEEAEGERDLYMEGERRVEALNEDLDEKLSKLVVEQCGEPIQQCGEPIHPMSFDAMLSEISQTISNQRKLIYQLEPVCNRLAAYVEGAFGRTPEDFDAALTMLIKELRRARGEL